MGVENRDFTVISRKGVIRYTLGQLEGSGTTLIQVSGTTQRGGEPLSFSAIGRDLSSALEGAFGFVEGRRILREHHAGSEGER